jgi:hypothetical protein
MRAASFVLGAPEAKELPCMTDEMDQPVTRRELREELAMTRREFREELANYPTRTELHEALEAWGNTIMDRMDKRMDVRFAAQSAQLTTQLTAQLTTQLTTQLTAETARLSAHLSHEIARHVTASEERLRSDMRAMLDPHHGVPERVTGLEARVDRLEAKVLAPKRRRRPTR